MQGENIVERVKRLCKTKGVSVSQMQQDLGLPQGGVYKWNKHTPSFPALQKMSAYFGVSIDYILEGADEQELIIDIRFELNKLVSMLRDNPNIVYENVQLSELSKQILIDNIQNTISVADKCQNA